MLCSSPTEATGNPGAAYVSHSTVLKITVFVRDEVPIRAFLRNTE